MRRSTIRPTTRLPLQPGIPSLRNPCGRLHRTFLGKELKILARVHLKRRLGRPLQQRKPRRTPILKPIRRLSCRKMTPSSENVPAKVLQPQVSFVIMDQKTGQVKAISGGRGTKTASLTLNRATDTTRQPGSTFKVITAFAPALDTCGATPGKRLLRRAIHGRNQNL